jgi:CheY-like chemotaxis protein
MHPSFDWSNSDLGNRASWPASLRLTVDIVLATPSPMLLVWGPDRIVVFNEAYATLAGSRHAQAPGGKTPALWPAALSTTREALEAALRGEASVQSRQKIPFIRDTGLEMAELDLHYLPIPDDQGAIRGSLIAMAPSPRMTVDVPSSDLRILVVEDNLDSQYLVCEMLRAFGHAVEGVAHAEGALQLLAKQEFDVLFSDVSLPGISGVELARLALGNHRRLKVIFASGYGESMLRHVEFPYLSLQKPYDLDQLQNVLTGIREELKVHR